MTDKIAVELCVQGSRGAAAVEKFNSLAAKLKQFFPDYDEESDFFEAATANDCAAAFPSVGVLKVGHD